ncbi:assimilatory nitrate reductase catalytic subunit NasC [Alkalicoccus luteus]|uniref:assimilatory nitrate reductase catalytic subunit NasC n=1 Tax=Alkalicoccus luteus TaxID=1237094 RepID=UPI0040340A03
MKHSLLHYYREKQKQSESEKVYDTQCPFCSMQCKKKVIEQSFVTRKQYKTEGVDNPVTKGRLCMKGMNAYAHAVHEDRLMHPVQKQADGSWKEVSWEEALALVREKFQSLQQQYGSDSVGVYGSASITNEESYLLGKLARVALKTKYIDYNGRFCMSSAATASKAVLGIDRGLTNALSDIPKAQVLLLSGTNIASCQPVMMPYLEEAKANGAFIIVIDPRKTETAAIADLHLEVTPGRDAALTNAMLASLMQQGLVNESFVKDRTEGWQELQPHLQSISIKDAADYAGVEVQKISDAVRIFAAAETGMVLTARGVEQQTDGHMAVRNLLNLVLLTGKIGREGCGYGAVTGQGNGQGGREHGQKADQLPGYRMIDNPEDRQHIADFWGVPEEELPGRGVSAYEMMEKVKERDIRGMLLVCSNPVVSNPNASFIKEALETLDFFVAVDLFISESAQYADLILPAASYLEDEGTMTNLEGRVTLREATKKPPGSTKPDWKIICELAEALGAAEHFPFRSAEEVFNELRHASRGGAADYYGMTYDRIRREEGLFWPCPDLDHPGTPRLFANSFGRPDGRALLTAVDSKAVQSTSIPTEKHPLLLTTGRVMAHYLTGVQTRRSTKLAARLYESFIELHPATADTYSIAEGDLVDVISDAGSITVRAQLTADIRRDTVFVPFHWAEHQNVNMLIPGKLDPVSRMPGYKSTPVSIKRHEPALQTTES